MIRWTLIKDENKIIKRTKEMLLNQEGIIALFINCLLMYINAL